MEQICEKIEQEVIEAICKLIPENRISCLLRYGPTKTNDGRSPADLDFLLLLDEFKEQDYLQIRTLKEQNMPIEIFIDYVAHIEARGMAQYKRGCHGAYFVYILATAKTLLGTNFFIDKVPRIPLQKAKKDLIDRIEEYFYRIQKYVLNADSEQVNDVTLKYIARIITDLLLINEDIDFADMHTYHYSDIIMSHLSNSSLFRANECAAIQEIYFSTAPRINQILPVINLLDRVFIKIMKTYHD